MKKAKVALSFLFALILSFNLASAYYFPSIRMVSQDLVFTVTDFLEPILMALFGPWSTMYVFETLLVFLIVMCIVYIALGKVPLFESQKAVRWILTIVVPLLSVRFFDYEWLITVFNTYKLLGIVLSSILPFILYFYFLYNVSGDNAAIRKLGWALWIAVYIGLWSSSYVTELNSLVYFWTFIAGAACLVFDRTIYRTFSISAESKKNRDFIEMQLIEINKEKAKLLDALKEGATDDRRFVERKIHELDKIRKELLRHKYL